jgi:hypothetical protein
VFTADPITCNELQTLNAYTYYITEKMFWGPKILDARCTDEQLDQNGACEAGCKTYSGCEPTPTTDVTSPGTKALNVLNCSETLGKKCEAYKTCFFPPKDGSSKTNPLADRSNPSAPYYKARGGLWLTLEAQSIFSGWSDPLLGYLEGAGFGVPSSRVGGIISDSNTPYQKAGVPHRDSCFERDTFVETTLEEGVRADGEYHTCGDPGDVQRGLNFVQDDPARSNKHKKPCHWKKTIYQTDVYTGKAGDKMFQVAAYQGKTKVVGKKNREDPFATWLETDASLWGEDVPVEGYGGTSFVPAMLQNKEGEKIHYEMQSMTESEMEKYMTEARKENPDLFPETYKVWAGTLGRPLDLSYSGLKEAEGDKSTLLLRRFTAEKLTRFTKNKMSATLTWFPASETAAAGSYMTYAEREAASSDNFQGPEQNPSCLINTKKKTDLNVYFGHADFYGCPTQLTEGGTVQKAQIKKDGKLVTPSGDTDQSYLEVEPVTGKTLKEQNVMGNYVMTRRGPMLTPQMKPAVLPYFATYTKTEFTKEQIDMVGGPLKLIGDSIPLLEGILWSFGVINCLIGALLIINGLCKKGDGSTMNKTSILPVDLDSRRRR